MSLDNKYRPANLSEIIGNKEVILTLKGMFKNKEAIPHSFLFYGSTGTGKTTVARIVAKELGCNENNIIEIDTAQFRGIDTVRDLRKNCQYTPLGGGVKVYILDEIHKATGDAQNALLKILEDPPDHVYFMLCTTDPQNLLPTVKGRCSQFQMQLLADNEMQVLLSSIVNGENDEIDEEIYEQIIQDGQGCPRNSIKILEKVLSTPKKHRLAIAKQAAEEQLEGIALCRALIKKQSWSTVKTILQGLKGQEPETIRRLVLGYASSVLLNKDDEVAGLILESFIEPFYNTGFPGLVYACYSVIKN
ncbi:MAG: AAA family ATPase [Candidatus Omnitrophica bacterium]|jgi:DNA polymerase-3 subunit gamma/tau|nr:AAA family ATPase [Candidatus Omnitrophota bacterium]